MSNYIKLHSDFFNSPLEFIDDGQEHNILDLCIILFRMNGESLKFESAKIVELISDFYGIYCQIIGGLDTVKVVVTSDYSNKNLELYGLQPAYDFFYMVDSYWEYQGKTLEGLDEATLMSRVRRVNFKIVKVNK